jgi:hypothetical protein
MRWVKIHIFAAQLAKKKQQCALPKEIQSVMTGYDPVFKDNVRKITLYDIPPPGLNSIFSSILRNGVT